MLQGSSTNLEGDGHPRKTGTVWTAIAFIITAVMGFEFLSSSWAISQLGWIAGPALMLVLSFRAYYTSTLLAASYLSGDPVIGQINCTYMDVVKDNLGCLQAKLCGTTQYLNLFSYAIGYISSSSLSMLAICRPSCLPSQEVGCPWEVSTIPYKIAFGAVAIIFSQIPTLDQVWWISTISAIMSLIYSTIGLGLEAAKLAVAKEIGGSLTGIKVGTITQEQKIYRILQAIGSIGFANSLFLVSIEIQDTIESPPPEYKTMKRATLASLTIAAIFYMFSGCLGYAAFGDLTPVNLFTGFGFYNPYWLLDIANVAIVIHHIGAYQVCSQPIFAFIEKTASEWFPHIIFINEYISIRMPVFQTHCKLNLFKLVWRSVFVIITTAISMFLPLFNDIVSFLGALGVCRLTVNFPVAIYIEQNRIPKWTQKWICLQMLSISCLLISIAAAVGSFARLISDVKG